MSRSLIVTLIIVGVLLLFGIGSCNYVKNTYNDLVAKDEFVKAKWGDVQAQYQRRSDLIPNLVATVKGAANFEKSTLEAVTDARARATSIQVDPTKLTPETIQKFQASQGQLTSALSRLLVASENYPDLKANKNFGDLQAEIEGTENRITVARMDFNDAVLQFNTAVRSFPANLIASRSGFAEKGSFSAEPDAQKAPKVQF